MAERALATAFVNIVPGTKDLEDYLKGKLQSDIQKPGETAGKNFGGKFATGLKGAMAGIGSLFVVKEVGQFAKGLIDAAEQGQKVDATLSNITKSMGLFGDKSGDVVKRLQDVATAQIGLTGIDDDAIKSAQAKLMTFSQVAKTADEMGGAFDRATSLAADLSAAGFGSLDSASVMLGKALQDPVKGVTALQRVGVSLTDTQKEQVKAFVKVGDVASAQNIILGEVSKQVGGTAQASATSSEKMKAKWEDLKQTLGTSLLPAFQDLTNFISDTVLPKVSDLVDGFDSLDDPTKKTIAGIGGVALVRLPLTTALASLTTAVQVLTGSWLGNTVAMVANKVAAIAHGIADAALAAYIWLSNTAIVTTTVSWIANTAAQVANKVALLAGAAAAGVATAAQWALNAAMDANPIGLVILAVAALVAGLTWFFTKTEAGRKIWAGFVSFLGDSMKNVGKFFSDAWTNITNIWNGGVKWFTDMGKHIVDGLWNGLKSAWNNLVSNVGSLFNGLVSFIKNLLGIHSPSRVMHEVGTNITDGLTNGITAGTPGVVGALKSMGTKIVGTVDDMLNQMFDVQVQAVQLAASVGAAWNSTLAAVTDSYLQTGMNPSSALMAAQAGLANPMTVGGVDFTAQILQAQAAAMQKGMAYSLYVDPTTGSTFAVQGNMTAADLKNAGVTSNYIQATTSNGNTTGNVGGAPAAASLIPVDPFAAIASWIGTPLAAGGFVSRPTRALVGEAGPEVVTPLKDFERMMGLDQPQADTRPIYADGIGLIGVIREVARGESRIEFDKNIGRLTMGVR